MSRIIPKVIYFIPDGDRTYARKKKCRTELAYSLAGITAIQLGEWNQELGAPKTIIVVPVSSEDNFRERSRRNLMTIHEVCFSICRLIQADNSKQLVLLGVDKLPDWCHKRKFEKLQTLAEKTIKSEVEITYIIMMATVVNSGPESWNRVIKETQDLPVADILVRPFSGRTSGLVPFQTDNAERFIIGFAQELTKASFRAFVLGHYQKNRAKGGK